MNKRQVGRNFRKLVRSLGGKNRFTQDRHLLNCPFHANLGINWKGGVLYWRCGSADSISTIVAAIHEAGHIFTNRRDPTDIFGGAYWLPEEDEIPFLGWEIQVALRCGLSMREWQEGVEDYDLGEFFAPLDPELIGDIGNLPRAQLISLEREASELSAQNGFLGWDNVPLSVRTEF